jgi:hypothetical protein
MIVQHPDDLPPNAPRCLRWFPTGVNCLRFYTVLFFSVVSILTASIYLIVTATTEESTGNCAMVTLLSSVIMFWLQPPTLADEKPPADDAEKSPKPQIYSQYSHDPRFHAAPIKPSWRVRFARSTATTSDDSDDSSSPPPLPPV